LSRYRALGATANRPRLAGIRRRTVAMRASDRPGTLTYPRTARTGRNPRAVIAAGGCVAAEGAGCSARSINRRQGIDIGEVENYPSPPACRHGFGRQIVMLSTDAKRCEPGLGSAMHELEAGRALEADARARSPIASAGAASDSGLMAAPLPSRRFRFRSSARPVPIRACRAASQRVPVAGWPGFRPAMRRRFARPAVRRWPCSTHIVEKAGFFAHDGGAGIAAAAATGRKPAVLSHWHNMILIVLGRAGPQRRANMPAVADGMRKGIP
jgi:hypothetical protein